MSRWVFSALALIALAAGCSEPAAPPSPPAPSPSGDAPADDAAPEEGASSDATSEETDEATVDAEPADGGGVATDDEAVVAADEMPEEPADAGEPLDDALAADEPAGEAQVFATFDEAMQATEPAINAAYQAGNLAQAIELMKKIHAQFPDEPMALAILLNISLTLGREMLNDSTTAEQGAAAIQDAAGHARNAAVVLDDLPNDVKERIVELIGSAFFEEACLFAMSGQNEEALSSLRDAIASGHSGLADSDADDRLASIRDNAEFQQLVAECKERVRADMRASFASFESFPFEFELTSFDGLPISLADYQGKVVIVDIWATWCGPCRMEIPSFVDLYDRYKAEGLEIVGINCGENGTLEDVKVELEAIKRETGLNYPCALGSDAVSNQVPSFQYFPTTLFLDRTGKVRYKMEGVHPRSAIEAAVVELLAEAAPAATEEPAVEEDAAAAVTPDAEAESTLRLVEEADAQDAVPVPGEAAAEEAAPAEEAAESP